MQRNKTYGCIKLSVPKNWEPKLISSRQLLIRRNTGLDSSLKCLNRHHLHVCKLSLYISIFMQISHFFSSHSRRGSYVQFDAPVFGEDESVRRSHESTSIRLLDFYLACHEYITLFYWRLYGMLRCQLLNSLIFRLKWTGVL